MIFIFFIYPLNICVCISEPKLLVRTYCGQKCIEVISLNIFMPGHGSDKDLFSFHYIVIIKYSNSVFRICGKKINLYS